MKKTMTKTKHKQFLISIIISILFFSTLFSCAIFPAQATTIFSDGFESGDASAWTATSGTPTYDTTVTYNGTYSMMANSNNEYTSKTLSSAQAEVYVSTMLRVSALPTGGQENVMIRAMNGANIVGQIGIKDLAGVPYWTLGYLNGGAIIFDISATNRLYANTWFNVTLHILCGTPGGGEYHVYINSVEIADLAHTAVNTVYSTVDIVRVGQPYTTITTNAYFDNVQVADSGGFTADPVTPPVDPPSEYPTGVLPYTGLGGDYCVYYDSYSVERWITDGKINNIAAYRDAGFNTSRIGFRFGSYPYMASASSLLDYTKFDRMLQIFDSYGLSVVPVAWDDQSMSSTFLSNYTAKWVEFATRYAGDDRISAISIFNEPTSSILTGTINSRTLFFQYARNLTKAIHAVDPNRVVIFPIWVFLYSSFNQYYTELQTNVADILTEPNVVFDITHPYYFENDWDWGLTPTAKAAKVDTDWISPAVTAFGSENCFAGETFAWLGEMTIPTTNYPAHMPSYALQTEWLREIIDVYAQYGVGFSVWSTISGQKYTAFQDIADEIDYPIETVLPEYSLTVTSTVGGSVTPAVGTHLFYNGTVVSIELTPTDGYIAVLTIDGVNVTLVDDVYELTMTANTTANALFYYPTATYYELTIASYTGGLTTPIIGTYLMLAGSNVTLEAYPQPDYQFQNWIINGVNDTNAATWFNITQNSTVHAIFILNPVPYTLNVVATQNGTITGFTSGTYEYQLNDQETFAAVPNSGYLFQCWVITFNDGTYYVTTDNPFTLTVTNNNMTLSVIFYVSEPLVNDLPVISTNWLLVFLNSGDYFGFFQAMFLNAFNSVDILYGMIVLLLMVPLYLRTKSFLLVCILWVLLGGFFLVTMPILSGFSIVFLALGIGGLLFRTVRPQN